MRMKIELSPHAEQQLQERNIKMEEIEEILKEPDQTVEGDKDRKIAQKIKVVDKKKFLYRVIYKKENAKYLIITVYRTTRIKKYMRG